MRLAGRKAFVTGGSRGVGRAIALELAREGADTAVTYLSRKTQAEETVAQVEAMGRRGVAVQCDAGDPDQVRRAVAQAESALGGLDILVHNAGVQGRLCHVSETTEEELKAVLDVNLFGAFYLMQAILPSMRKGPRGDMLFISSSGTKHRRDIGLPYDVAKKALEVMAQQFAAGLSQWGIRVNVVAPSMVDTDMTRETLRELAEREAEAAGPGAETNLEFLKPASEFPFGRIVEAEEVGKACVFFCSEDAGYISGQVLYLDGGAEWT